MSQVAALINLQELDLAADAARSRSETLPEREALPALVAKLAELDVSLGAAQTELAAMQSDEERLGLEVSQVARDIEAAEIERYSGKRMNQDESAAHDESQRLLRERKDSLEEQEMEILESLDVAESRIAELQNARAENRLEAERVKEAIVKVDTEVAAELERLGASRSGLCPSIPPSLLTAYDRVRAQPRSGGRGAALLAEGRCGACRIKLPSHETTKMLAEPEDAVIQCPQCRRLLIR